MASPILNYQLTVHRDYAADGLTKLWQVLLVDAATNDLFKATFVAFTTDTPEGKTAHEAAIAMLANPNTRAAYVPVAFDETISSRHEAIARDNGGTLNREREQLPPRFPGERRYVPGDGNAYGWPRRVV